MHRIFRAALILLTLAGCKAPVNRAQPTSSGGLSAKEFNKLRAINEAQANALETVRKVTESRESRCGTNEKRNVNPVDSPEWSTHTKVAGNERCPVQFLKEWAYDPTAQKLNFRHEMKTNRDSALTYRRAKGVITREGDPSRRTLVGTIHYDRIEIANIGFVDVEIQTNQRYGKHKGAGELRVTVKQAAWAHVGTMRWRTGRVEKTIYEVDGHSITEEGFNQLFSAYGLPEIMANSMKMR